MSIIQKLILKMRNISSSRCFKGMANAIPFFMLKLMKNVLVFGGTVAPPLDCQAKMS